MAVPKMVFDNDHCFICSCSFTANNKRSKEHVFPRWLLGDRDHPLYDQDLTRVDGSTIKYSATTVPCCEDCNAWMDKNLEKLICEAVRAGANNVRSVDEKILSLWMTKILYGD